MLSVPDTDATRFWAKVAKSDDPDGCWLWTAATSHNGYGFFKFRNRQLKAHRFSYEWHIGAIPDGLLILHRCDTPACVNPAHLFLGTHKTNAEDRTMKGRGADGERNGSRLHPERLARGDRSGPRLHPERYPRGESHPFRKSPELHARGERAGNAKLTADDVRLIRNRFAQGDITQTALAAEFGVTQMLVSQIVHRRIWKHVA